MCAARFPHPPLPPMGAPMMPPMMPMMQQPMMMGQPTTPPIFKAHIPNKLKKVGSILEFESVKEIKLSAKVQLEGLHVVPNGVNLPELGLFGRTKPDMMTRPFQVQIYGRNSESDDVAVLLAITVCGGVQWMPFSNSPEVEYIAFSGDYEELTIVLHGTTISSSDSSSTLPPYPSFLDELLLPSKLSVPGSSPTINPDYLQHEIFSSKPLMPFCQLCDKVSSIINETSMSYRSIDTLSHRISTRHGKSLVPRKEMAILVGKIFSLEKQVLVQLTLSQLLQKVQEFSDISTALQYSFQEKSSLPLEELDSLEDVLGDEANNLLCDYVVNCFQIFSVFPTANTKYSSPECETFEAFGLKLLNCCQWFMKNEFIANEFFSCGGLDRLLETIMMANYLPPSFLPHLLTCLLEACLISHQALPKLFQIHSLTRTSPYQQTVHLLSTHTAHDSDVALVAESLLALCSWYERVEQFKQLLTSSSITGVMKAMIQQINPQYADYENQQLLVVDYEEIFDTFEEKTQEDQNKQIKAIECSRQILETIPMIQNFVSSEFVPNWRSSMKRLTSSVSSLHLSSLGLLNVLKNSSYFSVVILFHSFAQLLNEYTQMIDLQHNLSMQLQTHSETMCDLVKEVFVLSYSFSNLEVLYTTLSNQSQATAVSSSGQSNEMNSNTIWNVICETFYPAQHHGSSTMPRHNRIYADFLFLDNTKLAQLDSFHYEMLCRSTNLRSITEQLDYFQANIFLLQTTDTFLVLCKTLVKEMHQPNANGGIFTEEMIQHFRNFYDFFHAILFTHELAFLQKLCYIYLWKYFAHELVELLPKLLQYILSYNGNHFNSITSSIGKDTAMDILFLTIYWIYKSVLYYTSANSILLQNISTTSTIPPLVKVYQPLVNFVQSILVITSDKSSTITSSTNSNKEGDSNEILDSLPVEEHPIKKEKEFQEIGKYAHYLKSVLLPLQDSVSAISQTNNIDTQRSSLWKEWESLLQSFSITQLAEKFAIHNWLLKNELVLCRILSPTSDKNMDSIQLSLANLNIHDDLPHTNRMLNNYRQLLKKLYFIIHGLFNRLFVTETSEKHLLSVQLAPQISKQDQFELEMHVDDGSFLEDIDQLVNKHIHHLDQVYSVFDSIFVILHHSLGAYLFLLKSLFAEDNCSIIYSHHDLIILIHLYLLLNNKLTQQFYSVTIQSLIRHMSKTIVQLLKESFSSQLQKKQKERVGDVEIKTDRSCDDKNGVEFSILDYILAYSIHPYHIHDRLILLKLINQLVPTTSSLKLEVSKRRKMNDSTCPVDGIVYTTHSTIGNAEENTKRLVFEENAIILLWRNVLQHSLQHAEHLVEHSMHSVSSISGEYSNPKLDWLELMQKNFLIPSVPLQEELITFFDKHLSFLLTQTEEISSHLNDESNETIPMNEISSGRVSQSLLLLLKTLIEYYFTALSGSISTNAATSEDIARYMVEQRLVYLLQSLSTAIQSVAFSYSLIRDGVVYWLFTLLNNTNTQAHIALLSVHIITTIFNQLQEMVTKLHVLEQPSSEPQSPKSPRSKLRSRKGKIVFPESLRDFLYQYGIQIVQLLPSLFYKFQDNSVFLASGYTLLQAIFHCFEINSSSIALQEDGAPFAPNLLLHYFYQLVVNVGQGFSIEFLTIKAWLFLEDTFQMIHEVVDIQKQYITNNAMETNYEPVDIEDQEKDASLSADEIITLLQQSYTQFHLAIVALRNVFEWIFHLYECQKITLFSMTKAMRTTLADPKKVLIRYQRLYVMWMTSISQYFPHLSMQLSATEYTKFHARHVQIANNLKVIVEYVNKYNKYASQKEDKFQGNRFVVQHAQMLQQQEKNFINTIQQSFPFVSTLVTGKSAASSADGGETDTIPIYFQQPFPMILSKIAEKDIWNQFVQQSGIGNDSHTPSSLWESDISDTIVQAIQGKHAFYSFASSCANSFFVQYEQLLVVDILQQVHDATLGKQKRQGDNGNGNGTSNSWEIVPTKKQRLLRSLVLPAGQEELSKVGPPPPPPPSHPPRHPPLPPSTSTGKPVMPPPPLPPNQPMTMTASVVIAPALPDFPSTAALPPTATGTAAPAMIQMPLQQYEDEEEARLFSMLKQPDTIPFPSLPPPPQPPTSSLGNGHGNGGRRAGSRFGANTAAVPPPFPPPPLPPSTGMDGGNSYGNYAGGMEGGEYSMMMMSGSSSADINTMNMQYGNNHTSNTSNSNGNGNNPPPPRPSHYYPSGPRPPRYQQHGQQNAYQPGSGSGSGGSGGVGMGGQYGGQYGGGGGRGRGLPRPPRGMYHHTHPNSNPNPNLNPYQPNPYQPPRN